MRELHDKYFKLAKKEGKLARSYYKLQEIDRREKIFDKNVHSSIDLGASPGSWLEYALEKTAGSAVICAVDIKLIAPKFKGKVQFKLADIRDVPVCAFAAVAEKFDVVLSDMAPSTSGVRVIDQARSLELCETAATFALANLRPGGKFVCKIFEGPEVASFRKGLQKHFAEVKLFKPDASRDESFEIYVIGLGFKPESRN